MSIVIKVVGVVDIQEVLSLPFKDNLDGYMCCRDDVHFIDSINLASNYDLDMHRKRGDIKYALQLSQI